MGMEITFPACSEKFFWWFGWVSSQCFGWLFFWWCQVGSRLVLQTTGLLMIILGLFGKFCAVFITIPDPVIGGMFLVMFGMVAAVGISNLQVHLIVVIHFYFIFHFIMISLWLYLNTHILMSHHLIHILFYVSVFLKVCGFELLQESLDSWFLNLQWSCAPNLVSLKPRRD